MFDEDDENERIPPTQQQKSKVVRGPSSSSPLLSSSSSLLTSSNITTNEESKRSLHPIPHLAEIFSEPKFLAEGGYGRVVSAIDLKYNNNNKKIVDSSRRRVAIKIMNFECSREDSRRLLNLSAFGDLAGLLPGQDYIPQHIAAELRAHDALREVKGTMPLLRVETWCDEASACVKKHLVYGFEEEIVECFVMLVLPLLAPLTRKSFSHAVSSNALPITASFKSLARALRDMHAQGWLHRDLSVTNIFVSSSSSSSSTKTEKQTEEEKNFIIGDFGLAVCTRAGRSAAVNQLFAPSTNACTTIWYRSPEILANPDAPFTTSHDSWALGVVVAELLLGYPIFPGMTRDEQIEEMTFSLGAKGEKCDKFWSDIFDSLSSCRQDGGEEKIKVLRAVSSHLLNFDCGKRSVQKFIDALE